MVRRGKISGVVLIVSLCATTTSPGADGARPSDSHCQSPSEQQTQNTVPGTAAPDTDLSKCGGVIRPPASSGDDNIEHRAPDVGETPIIPPAAAPQQQQNNPARR
jgi:hypothetical protein